MWRDDWWMLLTELFHLLQPILAYWCIDINMMKPTWIKLLITDYIINVLSWP